MKRETIDYLTNTRREGRLNEVVLELCAEALLIGKKFGLDPGTMIDILNQSTGMNNSTQRKFKQMVLSRTFDGGFWPRSDGERPRDRTRHCPGDGDRSAVLRLVQGIVGRGAGDVGVWPRAYRIGALQRDVGRGRALAVLGRGRPLHSSNSG